MVRDERSVVWISRTIGVLAVVTTSCTPGGSANATITPEYLAAMAKTAPSVEPGDRRVDVEELVRAASLRFRVPEELIMAVIWVESRFKPQVTSGSGAAGLMQLKPATAQHLAQRLGWPDPDPYDPRFNVVAGTFYLRLLLDRFDGSETLALAAYAAGPGAITRRIRDGRPIPRRAEEYARRVQEARRAFERGEIPDPREKIPDIVEAPPELDGAEIERLIMDADR